MSANTYALARIAIVERPRGYYLRWYYNGWHYWQFFGAAITKTTEGEKYRTYGTRSVAVNSGQLTQGQVEGLRTILNTTEVYLLTDKGWMVVRIEQGTAKVYDNQFAGYELNINVIVGSRLPSKETGYSPTVPIIIVPPVEQCETVIGTQIWLCKNWDTAYPASKVYDDDETNRPKYGGLYTYAQVMSAGFCPVGWHVATVDEWRTLIAYVGGMTTAGGKLKTAGLTYWQTPNTDADDAFDFDARGAGCWFILINPDWSVSVVYSKVNQYTYFWAASPAGTQMVYVMAYDTGEILEVPFVAATVPEYTPYFSVRFVKDVPALPTPVATAATAITTNGLTANWQTVAGATGYRLTVSELADFSTTVTGYNGVDVGNVLTAAVAGLMNGRTYYYRIQAYGGLAVSNYSNTITTVTLYGFLLTATGTGAGVSTLRLTVSASTVVTISGTGHFYSDAAGTLDESTSVTVLPTDSPFKEFSLRLPSGTANLLFSNVNNITGWGNETYRGWDGLANCPSMSGSNFLLPNCIKAFIYGNNTLSFNVNTLPANCTLFYCEGSNTVTGVMADIPSTLQHLSLFGNCTFSGNLSDIPANIITLVINGANTITGDLANIPATCTQIEIGGLNTVYGALASLKSGLLSLSIISGSITGDLADLPSTLQSLVINGANAITGDLADLPSGLTYCLLFGGTNPISGNVVDMPSGMTEFACDGTGVTITGNLSDLPSTLTRLTLAGLNTLTGNISGLPAGVYYLSVYGGNTISGDLASINTTMLLLNIGGLCQISDYTSGHTFSNRLFLFVIIPQAGYGLSTAEIDALLIDLALRDWQYYSGSPQGTLTLTGGNAARSSASDAAVATLAAKNVTVTTN